MDKATIKLFLPCLSDDDVAELHGAANADSYESAEWLPWYKMSLNRLVACAGTMAAALSLKPDDFLPSTRKKQLIEKAAELYRQHLLFAGIGPQESPQTIERYNLFAHDATIDFLRGCR